VFTVGSCARIVLLAVFTVGCSGGTDSPLAVSPSPLRWQLSGMVRCNGGGDPECHADFEGRPGLQSTGERNDPVNRDAVSRGLNQTNEKRRRLHGAVPAVRPSGLHRLILSLPCAPGFAFARPTSFRHPLCETPYSDSLHDDRNRRQLEAHDAPSVDVQTSHNTSSAKPENNRHQIFRVWNHRYNKGQRARCALG
jgi:hypothetical protein